MSKKTMSGHIGRKAITEFCDVSVDLEKAQNEQQDYDLKV
jgi:hypothetical protein